MTNIYRIKLFIVDITDCDKNNLENLFDYGQFVNDEIFIGIAISSPTFVFDLGLITSNYMVYNIDAFNNFEIKYPLITELLTHIGFNLTTNEILDIMLDENLDANRKFYLESMLYYKNNQYGKDINEYNLRVKHFDDLIHYFPEDFVSYKILENNDDFSETQLIINTFLTENELNDKFKEFLI